MAQLMKMGRQRISAVNSIPAPVGGWNAQDAISAMPPTDAVILENMFPNTTDVMLRRGSVNQVVGMAGTVETLAAYSSATVNQLFASTQTAIYNVTNFGPLLAPVFTGFTNGRWQFINYSVPGGAKWLLMVNGVDPLASYNGATWGAAPAITGIASNLLVHINEFKRRIWFTEINSTRAWYLAVDAIGGTATAFDVGSLFTNGGYLVATATWSLDAGQGMDDHLVFLSSRGQIAVYQGIDPSAAATFGLIGVFNAGSPIGRRCFMKFAGDLLLITQDGVVPLSKALLSDRVSMQSAFTSKIQYAMSEAITLYGANFGWKLLLFPAANMIILNVPISQIEFQQYAINTLNGSWCKFTGWNASCWELFNDEIYYGTVGGVIKAWTGESDNGVNITGDALPAFSYFGSQAQLKRWTMVRPIIQNTGDPGVSMNMNVDFRIQRPFGVVTIPVPAGGVWDTGIWDTSVWGGGTAIHDHWHTVSGIGYCGSLHLLLTSKNANVRWLATDFVYENGAVI